MKLRIARIKSLYILIKQSEIQESDAAILCSSYDFRNDLLAGIKALCLRFDDFTEAKRPTAFQPEHAQAIREFLLNLPTDTSALYVCCDQGESRSTAICAAILRWLGEKDINIWINPHYHPNALVYRLQCEALNVRITKLGIRYRLWLSRRAFAQTMNRK